MTSAAPAHCATLFYREPVADATETLAAALETTFQRFSAPLKRRLSGVDDLAFSAGAVSVAVTRSAGPVDPSAFDAARRPVQRQASDREVAMRLHRHEGVISISVTGGSRQDALALCYLVAATLVGETRPDLVHWMASGTLYTPDEMRALAGDPVRGTAPRLPQPAARAQRSVRKAAVRRLAPATQGATAAGGQTSLVPAPAAAPSTPQDQTGLPRC